MTGFVSGSGLAFVSGSQTGATSIDQVYVAGVSITHGGPRTHIWSFAAGSNNGNLSDVSRCPCDNSNQAEAALPLAFCSALLLL